MTRVRQVLVGLVVVIVLYAIYTRPTLTADAFAALMRGIGAVLSRCAEFLDDVLARFGGTRTS